MIESTSPSKYIYFRPDIRVFEVGSGPDSWWDLEYYDCTKGKWRALVGGYPHLENARIAFEHRGLENMLIEKRETFRRAWIGFFLVLVIVGLIIYSISR